MPPHGFEVLHIIVDASLQHRLIGNFSRSAAIAQIIENAGVRSGQVFEVIEQVDRIRNDEGAGSTADLSEEEADAVRYIHIAFGHAHRRTPARLKISRI